MGQILAFKSKNRHTNNDALIKKLIDISKQKEALINYISNAEKEGWRLVNENFIDEDIIEKFNLTLILDYYLFFEQNSKKSI